MAIFNTKLWVYQRLPTTPNLGLHMAPALKSCRFQCSRHRNRLSHRGWFLCPNRVRHSHHHRRQRMWRRFRSHTPTSPWRRDESEQCSKSPYHSIMVGLQGFPYWIFTISSWVGLKWIESPKMSSSNRGFEHCSSENILSGHPPDGNLFNNTTFEMFEFGMYLTYIVIACYIHRTGWFKIFLLSTFGSHSCDDVFQV